MLFEQLGNLGFEGGKGVISITVRVLIILSSYNDRKKLEALAKLSGPDDGFDDRELYLETMRILLPLLERVHEASERVTEEEVLNGVLALGNASRMVYDFQAIACHRRAKEGFVTLFEEDHGKSVDATYQLVFQTAKDDNERTAELRVLWERARVSLPAEAITYEVAHILGGRLREKGKHEEAKVSLLADLEGRRRALRAEHKDTLASLNLLWMVTRSLWGRIIQTRRGVRGTWRSYCFRNWTTRRRQ